MEKIRATYTINFAHPVAQISPLPNLVKELILLPSGWKMIIQMVMIMTMMTDDNGDQEGNRKRGADWTPPGLRLHSPSYLIFVTNATDGVCVRIFCPV